MSGHSTASLGARHPIHNWEYADATARAAATGFVAADLGKIALQSDNNTLWMLTVTTPTWVGVGNATGTVTAAAGSLTANALVLGAGTTDTKVAAGLTSDGISRLQLGVAGGAVGGVELRNATSGTVSFVPTTGALGTSILTLPALSGTLAVLQTSGGATFLHIDGAAGPSRLILDANNNVAKLLSWRTDNLPRWALRVDGNETGADAGGDLAFRRYNDAGTYVDSPLTFVRSTGNATFAHKVTTLATATIGAGFNLPHGTAPTSPADGDLWSTTAGAYMRVNGVTVGPFGVGIATDPIFDAAGDLIQGTGANTAARLAIGTAAQILAVNAGATAAEWQGTTGTGSVVRASAPTLISAIFTGQSLTGTQATSLLDLASTWNTTGTPTALKLNVTDTASNAASLLMDLQVGGVSKTTFIKGGELRLPSGNDSTKSLGFLADSATGWYRSAANQWCFNSSGTNWLAVFPATLRVASNLTLAWTASADSNQSADTSLSRISAGLIGVGTGAQGSFAGSLKLTNLTPTGGNGLAVFTVATLPATAATGLFQGSRVLVTDSNAASYTAGIGAVVAAGGATVVPVIYDGTNWRIG